MTQSTFTSGKSNMDTEEAARFRRELVEKTLKGLEGVSDAMEGLLRFAKAGDEVAFKRLVKEADSWNVAVELAVDAQREIAKKIARTLSTWPGNYAGHLAGTDSMQVELRNLGVGSALRDKAASSVRSRGQKRLDSPAAAISIDLYDHLVRARNKGVHERMAPWQERACKLPPLDSTSRRAWFECAWDFYVASYDGDILRDANAAKIAAKKYKGGYKPAGYVKDQVYKASHWGTKKTATSAS